MQALQISISGYNLKPCTLFAIFDPQNGKIIFSKFAELTIKRFKTALIITNNKELEHDSLFKKEDLIKAIEAFFWLKNNNLIIMDNSCSLCSPISAVNQDGFNNHGANYVIDSGITNKQVAILFGCLYALQNNSFNKMFDMYDDIYALKEGHIYMCYG